MEATPPPLPEPVSNCELENCILPMLARVRSLIENHFLGTPVTREVIEEIKNRAVLEIPKKYLPYLVLIIHASYGSVELSFDADWSGVEWVPKNCNLLQSRKKTLLTNILT